MEYIFIQSFTFQKVKIQFPCVCNIILLKCYSILILISFLLYITYKFNNECFFNDDGKKN